MKMDRGCQICWGITLLALTANGLWAAEFIPLGFATSESFLNDQLRVSEDGSIVVGVTPRVDAQTVRQLIQWTRATGPVVVLDGVTTGASITSDASIIATSRSISTPIGARQELITLTDGLIEALPDSEVLDRWQSPIISQDGTVIYGDRDLGGRYRFSRWNDDGPMELPIHGSDEWIDASGWATSANGSVLVGGRGPGRNTLAIRWTETDGVTELPMPETMEDGTTWGSGAFGVSADGRWSVGFVRDVLKPFQFDAIRWDGTTSYTRLIPSDASSGALARDVTLDGRVVVGHLYPADTLFPQLAGVWTETTGMVPLKDLLIDEYGLGDALRGWELTGLFDVTDDGRFVVGHAYNPSGEDEAFLVDFGPAPAGDFNRDGRLDVDDFERLADAIRQGLPLMMFDVTDDGSMNTEDRVAWIHDLKQTYFGDANLDGEFNRGDLVDVFTAGKYETDQDASWADGDWNGDGAFGSGDLTFAFQDGGYEQGPRGATQAVPEPSGFAMASTVLGMIARWASLRRKHVLL